MSIKIIVSGEKGCKPIKWNTSILTSAMCWWLSVFGIWNSVKSMSFRHFGCSLLRNSFHYWLLYGHWCTINLSQLRTDHKNCAKNHQKRRALKNIKDYTCAYLSDKINQNALALFLRRNSEVWAFSRLVDQNSGYPNPFITALSCSIVDPSFSCNPKMCGYSWVHLLTASSICSSIDVLLYIHEECQDFTGKCVRNHRNLCDLFRCGQTRHGTPNKQYFENNSIIMNGFVLFEKKNITLPETQFNQSITHYSGVRACVL